MCICQIVKPAVRWVLQSFQAYCRHESWNSTCVCVSDSVVCRHTVYSTCGLYLFREPNLLTKTLDTARYNELQQNLKVTDYNRFPANSLDMLSQSWCVSSTQIHISHQVLCCCHHATLSCACALCVFNGLCLQLKQQEQTGLDTRTREVKDKQRQMEREMNACRAKEVFN